MIALTVIYLIIICFLYRYIKDKDVKLADGFEWSAVIDRSLDPDIIQYYKQHHHEMIDSIVVKHKDEIEPERIDRL